MKRAKPTAKKVGQVVVGFALLFATALAFQNCSGYQMYDSTTGTDFSSTCGEGCDQSVEGLSLKLTNTRLSLQDLDLSPNRVADIAGYCDDAEFPQSDIQYQFTDGVAKEFDWIPTGIKCDDLGRFQISAAVPAVGASRTYQLFVRLAVSPGSGLFLFNSATAQKSFPIDIYK